MAIGLSRATLWSKLVCRVIRRDHRTPAGSLLLILKLSRSRIPRPTIEVAA
jgi:hypothetical protein